MRILTRLRVFNHLLKLKIGTRLYMLMLLPAVPIVLDTYLVVSIKSHEIAITHQKLDGIRYILHLNQLFRLSQELRDAEYALYTDIPLPNRRDAQVQQLELRENIPETIAGLELLNEELGSDFATDEKWREIRESLEKFLGHSSGNPFLPAGRNNRALLDLTREVVIASGLMLDTGSDTYHLLNIGLRNLPEMMELYGQIRIHAENLILERPTDVNEPQQILRLQTRADLYQWELETGMANILQYGDPRLRAVAPAYQLTFDSVLAYNQMINRNFLPDRDNVVDVVAQQQQYVEMMQSIQTLQSITNDLLRMLLQERVAQVERELYTILAITMLVALLTMLFAIILVISINQPIEAAIQLTEEMSSGNFTHKVKVYGKDEMAHFLSTINLMSTNLSQMIVGIHDTAKETAKSAEELSEAAAFLSVTAGEQASSVSDANASIQEIAGSTEGIATSINDSGLSIDDVSTRLKQLTGSTEKITRQMEELTELSRTATDMARGSEQRISQATAAMSRIQDSTRSITEFTGMITQISDQTNLLSLNAAIEAARAGDAGLGFAVVAQEITRLAEQTMESVKQVKQLIEETTVAVADGTGMVETAATELSDIIHEIKKIDIHTNSVMEEIRHQADNTGSISDNADALSKAFGVIKGSIEEQKRASQRVEATVGDLSRGATSVSENASRLSSLASNLKGWSGYMLQMIDVFQIESDNSDTSNTNNSGNSGQSQ